MGQSQEAANGWEPPQFVTGFVPLATITRELRGYLQWEKKKPLVARAYLEKRSSAASKDFLFVKNSIYSADTAECAWSGKWTSARSGSHYQCTYEQQFFKHRHSLRVKEGGYRKVTKNCGTLRCTSGDPTDVVFSSSDRFLNSGILGRRKNSNRRGKMRDAF